MNDERHNIPDRTIDLYALFFHLLGKLHIILLAALIGAAGMGLYAWQRAPLYSATSKLYTAGSDASASLSDLQMGSMLAFDYEEVFRTWEVHEMVRAELNLPYTYEQMQEMISVSIPANTRVLSITAIHPDAQMAADIANAYAAAGKAFIRQTLAAGEPSVFSVAPAPSTDSAAEIPRYMAAGFMLGAALIIGLFTVQFMLDDRPHAPEVLAQETGVPTLAVLPVIPRKAPEANTQRRRRQA